MKTKFPVSPFGFKVLKQVDKHSRGILLGDGRAKAGSVVFLELVGQMCSYTGEGARKARTGWTPWCGRSPTSF